MIFEPPSLRDYRYHCSVCAYAQMQAAVSTPKARMPWHKPKPATGSQWCDGSNKAPARTEVVKDRGLARGHVRSDLGKYDWMLS